MNCLQTYWRKHLTVDNKPISFEPFYSYTLRKTARTNFSDFGEWAVCEKMIGHTLPGETDKYDYNTYSDKMRPIYQKWYELNERIKENKSNISYLKKKVNYF